MNDDKHIPSEHKIEDVDIDSIGTTEERLFKFQIKQSDIDNVVQELTQFKQLFETISTKQEHMMERNNHNTIGEKKNIVNTFETYLDSLPMLDINQEFFSLRKQIGNFYNDANLDSDSHLSLYTRILEFLIPEITKKYSHNTDKLSLIILSLIKVFMFDYRLIEKFKSETTNLSIIKNINEIMDSVMKVNQTKDLFDSIDETMEQTDNVASATEELSASVTSILETVKSVSINTSKLLDDISTGQIEIETSLNDILLLNRGFAKSKANINDLVTDIQSISQIIELIKNVSEQTTLLAINASIEASRAGEHGKGFSVIADEIRNLSEKTTESVENITKVIKNVEDDTRKVDRNTEELFEELKEKTKRAQKSISTLDDITSQTRELGNFTKNMNEILDEQYVSTQKIKKFLDDVVRTSSVVEDLAEETGETIYSLSKEIENLRTKTIELIPDLRHKHFLNIVKTEEKMQQWWIYNALLGYHTFSEDEIPSNTTNFWSWYAKAKNNPIISASFSFKKLEEKHLELYHIEEKIRYMISKNKKEEATKLIPELEKRTEEISQLLEIIETELG